MPKAARLDAVSPPELVPQLISIAKATRALHGMKLAALGFYNGQDELLLAADKTGRTISAMADLLAIRPSTVSKMIDRLIEKGLMKRAGDPNDGRRTLVCITTAGLHAQKQVAKARKELEADLIKSLGVDLHFDIASSLSECTQHLIKTLKRVR